MTTPLTDERRAALSSLITNWFSTLDADGRLIREFDYFDESKIDELIDQAIAPTIADAVECVRTAADVPPHVRFSMESTARWLESGCDPRAAAKEIRASLAKLDAAPAAPVAAAESPSLANACEVLRDAVAAKSMLAIGMVHGLASFAKEDATAMRPETTSEHIARDIREGRFPKQSEPKMVPVVQDVAADESTIDTKAIAESLERMIVDWYADCKRTRLDWKQMAGVIKLRLDRFLKRAAVSPTHGNAMQLSEARQLLAHASEFAMMQLDEDWHERAAALLALPPPAVSASAPPARCQCQACCRGTTHASDCAVHNEPAYPNGPCDCGAIPPAPGADMWVPKSLALPPVPGWYLVMLTPDNDWELMSDTPIQVEFGAYKHMPQAFTHFYDGRPDEDITEAVTYWTRLPAPPRPAAPAAVEFSYALSQRAETWSGSFDSIEEALAEALGPAGADKRDIIVWVGQNQPIDIDYDSLAEEVIERIQEQAYDQVGEVADVIGPYEEKETKLLSLAIKRWIDEHGQISCYRIDHSIAYGPGSPEYESAIALLRERDGGTT